jgi:hypothetical protein
MPSGRRDVLKAALGAAALTFLPSARARLPLLSETEPDAVALDYVADAARVSAAARSLYRPGSSCRSCYFYQGKASADSAPCTVFAGWRVGPTGWCREFTPR